MTTASFDRLLRASRLALPAIGRDDDFRADRYIRLTRPDREKLEGKLKSGPPRSSQGGVRRVKKGGASSKYTPSSGSGFAHSSMSTRTQGVFDKRQRAIVKVHYFNHAGGGGAALKAHTRYVARDAAGRDDLSELAPPPGDGAKPREAESQARAHASYLRRDSVDSGGVFYDAVSDGVDGAARTEAWARSDKRHFRVILSAENGASLHDLPSYTREVMVRAEAALGTKLQWIAVDHWDTAHPHTHLIIRGRRANGQDLILPRDFIRYDFHAIARDVATESLGPRSPADERLALDREIVRQGPTRLDRMIAAQLPADRTIRMAQLEASNGDPHMTRALKARARELERMGLAREVRGNVFAFTSDWRERLNAMELHLDIRRRIVLERVERSPVLQRVDRALGRGLMDR